MNQIIWFSEIKEDDFSLVGSKALGLSVLYGLRLPVPNGFVISSYAFSQYLEYSTLKSNILNLLNNLDVDNNIILEETSDKIIDLILSSQVSHHLKDKILESYDNLNIDRAVSQAVGGNIINSFIKAGRELPFVAVRVSSNFDNNCKFEVYLNVRGRDELIFAIQKCWASLFKPNNLKYFIKEGFSLEDSLVSVVIQKMVDADKSGFVFSGDNIKVKSVLGLGTVFSDNVEYDIYFLDKENLGIKDKQLGLQHYGYFRDRYTGKNVKNNFSDGGGSIQKVRDEDISYLAEYARTLEQVYNKPVEIEWTMESGKIYLVGVKPYIANEESIAIPEITVENNLQEIKDDLVISENVNSDIKKQIASKLIYHLMFSVSYKQQGMLDRISLDYIKDLLKGLGARYGFEFFNFGINNDEFHLVLGASPKYSPNEILNVIKSISTKKILDDYSELRDILWGGDFWDETYSIHTLDKDSALKAIKGHFNSSENFKFVDF